MAINPIGIVTHRIRTAIAFLMISNLKNKSERPFTCNKFKLMAWIGYHIMAKQIICNKVAAKSHCSFSNNKTNGSATAESPTNKGKIRKADRRKKRR